MSRLFAARLAAIAMVVGGAGALTAAIRAPIGGPLSPTEPAGLEQAHVHAEGLPDSVVARAVAAHPFRPDRRPAARAYEPAAPGAETAAAEPVPRPALRLAGLLWGERPRVVLEGVPGREGGAILAAGDTVAGLRVRRIGRDRAVIRGYDTTWVLTPRGLW